MHSESRGETRSESVDHADLDGFFRMYRRMVYAVCFRILANRCDAEDVSQETFAVCARSLPRIHTNVRSWLHGTARRLSLKLIRSRDRALLRAHVYAGDEPTHTAWLNGYVRRELCDEVRQALAAIEPEHRDLLIRRFLGGATLQEIADEYSISHVAVLKRQRRAVDRLRQELEARQVVCVWPVLVGLLGWRHAARAGLSGAGSSVARQAAALLRTLTGAVERLRPTLFRWTAGAALWGGAATPVIRNAAVVLCLAAVCAVLIDTPTGVLKEEDDTDAAASTAAEGAAPVASFGLARRQTSGSIPTASGLTSPVRTGSSRATAGVQPTTEARADREVVRLAVDRASSPASLMLPRRAGSEVEPSGAEHDAVTMANSAVAPFRGQSQFGAAGAAGTTAYQPRTIDPLQTSLQEIPTVPGPLLVAQVDPPAEPAFERQSERNREGNREEPQLRGSQYQQAREQATERRQTQTQTQAQTERQTQSRSGAGDESRQADGIEQQGQADGAGQSQPVAADRQQGSSDGMVRWDGVASAGAGAPAMVAVSVDLGQGTLMGAPDSGAGCSTFSADPDAPSYVVQRGEMTRTGASGEPVEVASVEVVEVVDGGSVVEKAPLLNVSGNVGAWKQMSAVLTLDKAGGIEASTLWISSAPTQTGGNGGGSSRPAAIPGDIDISWSAVDGQSYRVLVSTDPNVVPWVPARESIVSRDGFADCTIPLPGESAYVRIEAE